MSDTLDALLREIDREHKHVERYDEFGKRLLALTTEGVAWSTLEKSKYALSYFLDHALASAKKGDKVAFEKLVPYVQRVMLNAGFLKDALSNRGLPVLVTSGVSALERPVTVYRTLKLMLAVLSLPSGIESPEKSQRRAEKLSTDSLAEILGVVEAYGGELQLVGSADEKLVNARRRAVETAMRILVRLTRFPMCTTVLSFQTYGSIVSTLTVQRLLSLIEVQDTVLTTVVCEYISNVFPYGDPALVLELQREMYGERAVTFLQLVQHCITGAKDEVKSMRRTMTRRAMSLVLNEERGYELLRKMFPLPLLEFLEVGIGYTLTKPLKTRPPVFTRKELLDYIPELKAWGKLAAPSFSECYIMKQTNELNFELFWEMIDKDYNCSRLKWSTKNLVEISGIISAELKYTSVAGRKLTLRDVPFQSIRENTSEEPIMVGGEESPNLSYTTNKKLNIMGYKILSLFTELKFLQAVKNEGDSAMNQRLVTDLPVPSNNQRRIICKDVYDLDWNKNSLENGELYLPNVGKIVIPILSYIYNLSSDDENNTEDDTTDPVVDEYLKIIYLLALNKPISVVSDHMFHFISLILQRCNQIVGSKKCNRAQRERVNKILQNIINILKVLVDKEELSFNVCSGILKYGIHNNLINHIKYLIGSDEENYILENTTGEMNCFVEYVHSISNLFDLFRTILCTMHRDSYPLITPEIYVLLSKFVIKVFIIRYNALNKRVKREDHHIDSTTMGLLNTYIRFLDTLDMYTLCKKYHFTSGIIELLILVLLMKKTEVYIWDDNTLNQKLENGVKLITQPSPLKKPAPVDLSHQSEKSEQIQNETTQQETVNNANNSAAPEGNNTGESIQNQNENESKNGKEDVVATDMDQFDIFKYNVVQFIMKVHSCQEINTDNTTDQNERNDETRSYLYHYVPSTAIIKLNEIYKKNISLKKTLSEEDAAVFLSILHSEMLSPQLIYSNMYRCNTIRCIVETLSEWLNYVNPETRQKEDITFITYINLKQRHDSNVFNGKLQFSFVTIQDHIVITKVSYPLVEITWDDDKLVNDDGRNRFVIVQGNRYNEIGGVYIELYVKQPLARIVRSDVFYNNALKWIYANRQDASDMYNQRKPTDESFLSLFTNVIKSFYYINRYNTSLFTGTLEDEFKLSNIFIELNVDVKKPSLASCYLEMMEYTQLILNEFVGKLSNEDEKVEIVKNYITAIKGVINTGIIRLSKNYSAEKIIHLLNVFLSRVNKGGFEVLKFEYWLRGDKNIRDAYKTDLATLKCTGLRIATTETADKLNDKRLIKNAGLMLVTEGFFFKNNDNINRDERKGRKGEKEVKQTNNNNGTWNKGKKGAASKQQTASLSAEQDSEQAKQKQQIDATPATDAASVGQEGKTDNSELENILTNISLYASSIIQNIHKLSISKDSDKKITEPTKKTETLQTDVTISTIFPLAILEDVNHREQFAKIISNGECFSTPLAIWDPSMSLELNEFILTYLSESILKNDDLEECNMGEIRYSIFDREPVVNGVIIRGFANTGSKEAAGKYKNLASHINDDFAEECMMMTIEEIERETYRKRGNEQADLLLYSSLIQSLDYTQNSEFQINKVKMFNDLLKLSLGGKNNARYMGYSIMYFYKLFSYLLPGDNTIKTVSSFTQNSISLLCSKVSVCFNIWLATNSSSEDDTHEAFVMFTQCLPLLYLLLTRYEYVREYLNTKNFLLVIRSFLILIKSIMQLNSSDDKTKSRGSSRVQEKRDTKKYNDIFMLYVCHFTHVLAIAPKKKKVQKVLEILINPDFTDTLINIKIPLVDAFKPNLIQSLDGSVSKLSTATNASVSAASAPSTNSNILTVANTTTAATGSNTGASGASALSDSVFTEPAKTLMSLMNKAEIFNPLYYYTLDIVSENLEFLDSELEKNVECANTMLKFEASRTSVVNTPTSPSASTAATDEISAVSLIADKWDTRIVGYWPTSYSKELKVGGVYIRAYIKQHHFREVDTKSLLDSLCKEVSMFARDETRCNLKDVKKNSPLGLMIVCIIKILEFHSELSRRSSLFDLATSLIRIVSYVSLKQIDAQESGSQESPKEESSNPNEAIILGDCISLITKIVSIPEALVIFKKPENIFCIVAMLIDQTMSEKNTERILGTMKFLCINGKVGDMLDLVTRLGLPVALMYHMFLPNQELAHLACEALSALVFNSPKAGEMIEYCLPKCIYEKRDHDADDIMEDIKELSVEEAGAWNDALYKECVLIARADTSAIKSTIWEPNRVFERVCEVIPDLKEENPADDPTNDGQDDEPKNDN